MAAKTFLFVLTFGVALGCSQAGAGVVQWRMEDGGNGHWYEPVVADGGPVTWDEASSAATAAGGYLATLTSAEENVFVFSLVTDAKYWGGQVGDHGPWLGGVQSPATSVPSANWQWVTGEAWNFENWYPGEPNDWNGFPEDRLIFYKNSAQWDDFPNDWFGAGPLPAYIIEYSVQAVPEPSSLILWTLLGIVGLVVGDHRKAATCFGPPSWWP